VVVGAVAVVPGLLRGEAPAWPGEGLLVQRPCNNSRGRCLIKSYRSPLWIKKNTGYGRVLACREAHIEATCAVSMAVAAT
jgi:hypothetical protein